MTLGLVGGGDSQGDPWFGWGWGVTLGLVGGGDSQGGPWFGWGWRLTG